MTTRRILAALIAMLSLVVLVGGSVVAGLAFWRVAGQSRGIAGLAFWRVADQPGGDQLLVIDAEQRLRLVDANGNERLLADDLSGDEFRYPAAAPDGERIAFISSDEQGLALTSLHLDSGERTELYRSSDAPPMYLTWSPDSSTISFLSNRSEGGFGIHIVAADGSSESSLISTTPGSSYFAWQPNSERLLLHVGGSSFEDGRVQVYAKGGSEPLRELRDPGFFQSPAWSVDGDSFFYVAQPPISGPPTPDAIESVLTRVSATGEETEVLASEQGAALFFSRAPGSDAIAYITAGPGGFGALKVVGPNGGAPRVVSRPDDQIPAFFWSPDGNQLAYLTFEARENQLPELTWHVVSGDGGDVRELVSFVPSRSFVSVLNFFDAYAFALELWSPDGTQLTYATNDGVYSVDVASGETTRRADGVLATWAR